MRGDRRNRSQHRLNDPSNLATRIDQPQMISTTVPELMSVVLGDPQETFRRVVILILVKLDRDAQQLNYHILI